MLNRRSFLSATAGFAVAGLASPLSAAASELAGIKLAAMRGSINAGEFGIFPITEVIVSEQAVVIKAQHPQGPLDLRLTFVGDAFTGSWQLGTDVGEMAGKRVK